MMHSRSYINILTLLAGIILVGAHYYYFEGMVARNDDVAMLGYVSGELFTLEPNEYMVHINVIIGYALKYLFIQFPSYNWYAILLQSLTALGLFLGIAHLIRYISTNRDYILPGILIIFICLYFSIYSSLHITYTLVAANLSCNALLIWYFSGVKDKKYLVVLLVVMMFVITSLLRVNSLLLVLVVSFPVIILMLLMKDRRRHAILILSLTSVLAITGIIAHAYYEFSDDEIREYREYSNVRERVHGRPHLYGGEALSRDMAEVGWSMNDLLMFRSWNYADSQIFSKEKLERILDVRTFATFDTVQKTKEVIKRDWKYIPVFLGLIFVIFLLYRDKKLVVATLGVLAWYLFVILLLVTFMRFPTRIAYGFYCASLINIAFLPVLMECRKVRMTRVANASVIGITLVAAMYSSYITFAFMGRFAGEWEYQRQFTRLTELDPDGLYVVWGSSMAIDQYPAKLSPKSVPRLNILFLAWPTFSPFHYEMLDHFRLKDLYLDMLDNDNVYLIAQEWRIELLKAFMQEHYNMDIYVIGKKGLPKIGTVYKLSRNSPG